MFGKRVSEYLDFQKVFLVLVAVVGLLRLGLSIAGVPNTVTRWLPMNVISWAAVVYYGVAVYTRGFGSYRHLLPLGFFQILAQQLVAVLGIVLAMGGRDNVYSAPEFTFGMPPGTHLASHLTIGLVGPSLLFWGVGSLVMLVTRKVVRRPAPRRAAE
jgi:hypothetical protein